MNYRLDRYGNRLSALGFGCMRFKKKNGRVDMELAEKLIKTAVEKGIDLYAALRGHACFEALDAIGDAIYTGNTGTNLCDFNVLYIPKKA